MTRRIPSGDVCAREPLERGTVRCITCGKVHDCYQTEVKYKADVGTYTSRSWASLDDGHPYRPESWRHVAIRYGFTLEEERADEALA